MTMTSCIVDISAHAALMKRVAANEFCKDGSGTAPIVFPLGPHGYWPQILLSWFEQHGIECKQFPTAIYGVRAKMKREQILAFVSDCYDGIQSYSAPEQMLTWKGEAYLVNCLTNFRAFLAKNLARNRRYFVEAMEDG